MSETVVDTGIIAQAVQLACRAPSLHNSQPWRWVAEGGALHLFADPSRIGHHTDSTGREVIISCGAVLDHLRVASAAAGWEAVIHRFPNTTDQDHLASIEFRRMEFVTDAQRALAEAIGHRRTDRLPFAAPTGWHSFETVLRNIVESRGVDLDMIGDSGRPMLAHISRLTEHLRRQDASYEAELLWWTGYSDDDEGIPPSALVSDADTERVDVGRHFPAAGDNDRRPEVERDHSLVLVLSTYDDSRKYALRCGEVLSMVLLECTAVGLATCTLTHMIEIHTSREAISRLTGNIREPQVLIRVGSVPENDCPPPPTPRRALSAVLDI